MVKRFRRSRRYRKKSFRKRRYSRKKFGKSKMTKYDGTVYSKVASIVSVQYSATYGCASCNIQWGSVNTIPAGGGMRITDCTEFTTLEQQYEQFRIKGLKYKWIPFSQMTCNTGTTGPSGYLEGRQCYSTNVMLGAGFSETNMRQRQGYRAFNAGRPQKGYINCLAHYKKFNQNWLDTQGTYYDTANTQFQFETWGIPDGQTIGRMECTWYVQFRTMKPFGS